MSAFINKFVSLLSRLPTLQRAHDVTSGAQKLARPYEVCPDGRHECPHQTSCCLTDTGSYACCPIPEAVCCSDGIHCCPKNTVCDMDAGRCLGSSSGVIDIGPAERDRLTASLVSQQSQLCPDGESRCPEHQTCCLLSTGDWGCCPAPEAVCCKDGKHCCPKGYKCDDDRGVCISSAETIPLTQRGSDSTACPDPTWQCQNGTTCCPLGNNEWGCCNLPNAVCCEDQAHCCPENYKCDVERNQCVKSDADSVPFAGIQTTLKSLRCTEFGYHCPEHTRCDARSGKCVPDTRGEITWFRKLPALRRSTVPSSETSWITCAGSEFQCPQNTTCCKLLGGDWGCCPSPNAVCCRDKLHCCPEGYICSDEDSSCIRQSGPTSVIKPVQGLAPQDTICPDKRSFCSDHQSCCLLVDGDFGCCPLANGTCCADRTHCCPEGTMCAEGQGECIRPPAVGLQSKRIAARRMTPLPAAASTDYVPPPFYRVRFPGQVIRTGWCSECGENGYCCPDSRGAHNRMCCDQAGSMCCPDGLHCCPPGTKCAGNGQCDQIIEDRFLAPFLIASNKLGTSVTETSLIEAKKCHPAMLDPRLLLNYFRQYKSVRWTICPDRKHACHLDEQCCPSAEQGYVCAPKTGTCCSRNANSYCPKGSHCSEDGEQCHLTDGA